MLRRAQAARLLAVDRETPGTLLLLLGRDEAAIGSAEGSGLRVADASVADRHAIIRYARGRYYVVDSKSAGGTFVNGRRIRRKQESEARRQYPFWRRSSVPIYRSRRAQAAA